MTVVGLTRRNKTKPKPTVSSDFKIPTIVLVSPSSSPGLRGASEGQTSPPQPLVIADLLTGREGLGGGRSEQPTDTLEANRQECSLTQFSLALTPVLGGV